MRQAFRVPVGWSDHTPGWLAPVIATSLGAAVVEKHFTTDRSRPGPDHRFALEPDELAEMVRAIRDTAALGDGVKRRAPAEDDLYVTARRSLFASRAIEAGAIVRPDDVAVLRLAPDSRSPTSKGGRSNRPPPDRAARAAVMGHVLIDAAVRAAVDERGSG